MEVTTALPEPKIEGEPKAAEAESATSGMASAAATSDVVKVEDEGEVMVDVEKDNKDEPTTKEDEKEDLKRHQKVAAAAGAASTAEASLPPPPAPAKVKAAGGGTAGGSSSSSGRRTLSERSDEGEEGGSGGGRPTRRLRGKKESEQPVVGAAPGDSDSLLENKRLSRYGQAISLLIIGLDAKVKIIKLPKSTLSLAQLVDDFS